MRLLVSWLRDFVDVQAPADEIAGRIGLRGFEVASIEPVGGDDAVIDLEVTANRPDCLSVIGLAREVATIYDLPLNVPASMSDASRVQGSPATPAAADSSPSGARIATQALAGMPTGLRVTIDDDDLCPRYAAAVADAAVGASPAWLAARLQAAGVRPINNIVDVTNYVLIELGHPTHAFDLEKLAGPAIRVRRAAAGETLTTLDGVARKLEPEMLVIADRDRAQAIAGVMGGAGSEVSPGTRRVLFESAYFKPASVRRTGKRLGLKTEASARFERGADISAPPAALARIGALLQQIAAGRIAGPFIDVYPSPRRPAQLHLRRARLASLLGAAVPDPEVGRILRALGLTVADAGDGWDVTAPTFRVDLLREVDLIEEVGRHFGFDKLAATFPLVTQPAAPPDPRIPRDQLVRRVLTAAGLSEAVTFGFIEAKAAQAFATAGAQPAVALANPLSAKFDTLRPLLIPGLVDAVAHNRRHGRDDVGLFEIGTRFTPAGEARAVAVAWTGPAAPLHWSGGARAVDFFDVKGVVEQLSHALDVPVRFEPGDQPFLAPGQAAAIVCADGAPHGAAVGFAGQVAPAIADARGLTRHDRVFVAEIDLDRLARARRGSSDATRPLPRHPHVVRDLSIIVPETLPAETIRGTIQAAGRSGAAPLTGAAFFDRYKGKGVPEGSVSLSVRLVFQAPDRTLTDAEVDRSVAAVLAALVRDHGATQR